MSNPIRPHGTIMLLLGALFIFFAMGSCIDKTGDERTSAKDALLLDAGIGYERLATLLERDPGTLLLLDVRTAEEFEQGHIPGAVLLPYDEIEGVFKESDKDKPIVVYCRSGRRSALALETLRGMGYRNVSDFGGIVNWKGKLEP